jgi:hypothetical protein
LELGYAEDEDEKKQAEDSTVILMKQDKRSGLITPATSSKQNVNLIPIFHSTFIFQKQEFKKGSTVLGQYERSADLKDLVAEEKRTTAEDQLNMFNRAAMMTATNKVDDDMAVDDQMIEHQKKRRHTEKDSRATHSKQVSGNSLFRKLKNDQLTFELCIEFSHLL